MIFRKCLILPSMYFIRRHCVDHILRFHKPSNEELHVKGWVKSLRSHKDTTFISVNDGSCLQNLQVVIPSDCFQHPVAATYGSCVHVTGLLAESGGSQQMFDLKATEVHLLGKCDNKEYPFKAKKSHPPKYTRQFLHLRPRTNYFSSLLRVRNSLTQALHKVLQDDGYIQVHTPILTSNDCEGAGEVFEVEPGNSKILQDKANSEGDIPQHFFNVPTFLTVSGQLHLEAVSGGFCKVYTFGPTFRAENSRGRHHLAEFYMLEAELSFTDDLEDLMKVMESLIQKSTHHIVEKNINDVHQHWKSLQSPDHEKMVDDLISKQYIRMTYTEAINILQKHNDKFTLKVQWGDDMQKEHERYIVKHCDNMPVFVTDFPANIKPFYMKLNADNRTVAAVDLLLPGVGEVCGGSLREAQLNVLEDKLEELGLLENLSWYIDLRRFGSCPHGGFGLGFERQLMAVLGIDNIRDTIPFPRAVNSCKL